MGQKLKDIMKRINGRVSYEINRINGVSNQIFDKYHISNIYSKNSYYKVIGYIIGNPFKHGLVKNLEELKNYEFCNYAEKVKEFGKEWLNEIICKVKNLNWDRNGD